ncbi:MAG: hypothetical protein HQL19_04780 [Candidatus Omnitrophica bacterium]|nr:hypothetical protein [Candidatus Omnitrophota bacterium]
MIKIVDDQISREELVILADETFKTMVKGVADLERRVIAVGGSLHADAEALLLENGSRQQDLWGFNINFNDTLESSLEYTSMINIRPKDGNMSMHIKRVDICEKVLALVRERVRWQA